MRSVQRTLSFQSINRGPRGILCTRGEKAHTSIRVSIIAHDNAISKAQCRRTLLCKNYGAAIIYRCAVNGFLSFTF